MNPFKRMIAGLGAQSAPFGFAPNDPDPAYRAGWGVIGDMGANLVANNQGGVDPFANLGASLQQAKTQGTERNRQQFTAQQLMEEAAMRKQKRETEEAERQKKNDWLRSISDPNMRATLEANPSLIDDYVLRTNPMFQQPEKPTFMEVNGKIVNPMTGEVVFDGGGSSDGIMGQVAERQMAAEAMGLTPEDPAYKAYILTGKMPREDQAPLTATDKKAILEADDAVLANTNVIQQLESVLKPDASGKSLNDRAGYGATAGLQSWAARNDPTGIFDDAQGQATTELQNIVLNQALSSLKSIFGAAPTEGERQILVDLQASIDKTPAERKAIIDRAIRAARVRLKFNEERAAGLRGGSYYKPGGANDGVPDLTQMSDEELEALANGQ